MPLWGLDASTGAAGDANKPKYLNQKQKEETFADSRGWVHKNAKGFEEVLVSIKTLQTKIGAANITSVSFDTTTQTAAAGTATAYYDEVIEFNGANRPTLAIVNSKGTNLTSSNGAITTDGNAIAFGYTVTDGAIPTTSGGSISTAGTGYTEGAAVAVTISGGNGTGATGTLVVNASGNVTALTITDGGSAFRKTDILTLTESGGGSNARFTISAVTGGLSVVAQAFGGTPDIEDVGTSTNADAAITAGISIGTATFTF